MPKPMDVVGDIIEYETGNLSSEGILRLFSNLIKTRLAWSLQGAYGRTAAALIENGMLTKRGGITKKARDLLDSSGG